MNVNTQIEWAVPAGMYFIHLPFSYGEVATGITLEGHRLIYGERAFFENGPDGDVNVDDCREGYLALSSRENQETRWLVEEERVLAGLVYPRVGRCRGRHLNGTRQRNVQFRASFRHLLCLQ